MAFHDGVPTLRELQQAVGGLVEAVTFSLADPKRRSGSTRKASSSREPQRNWKADAVCPLAWGDWTAGDVAFTGGVGPAGETLALGDGQVAELRRIDNRVHILLFDGNDASWTVIG